MDVRAVRDVLHERTEGLPLAVEQGVLLPRERRDLVRMNGEWHVASSPR